MVYRAGEVEVLLTVNDSDVARADKNVKATGDKIEKRPIKAKVDADTKTAIDRMEQVETAAKKIVSERAVVTLDADIDKAQKQFDRTQNRLEDLRLRADAGFEVGADIRRAERQLDRVSKTLDGLTRLRSEVTVEANPDAALKAIARVETAKQVVSRETAVRVNANVAAAEKSVEGLRSELEYLRSLSPTVDVTADVRQAEARLAGAEAALKDLQGARATMQVNVAADGAKQELQDVADVAEESGADGGRRGGVAMVGGIVGALATIPIAGAIAGIAKTVAETVSEAFQAGLSVEARTDRLQALTGVDEAAAGRLARAAGEAYASNFGESIESNMDTARLALQFRIIDGNASNAEAKKVVEGLAGIADVLDEDVRKTAESTATLLRTGLAKDAKNAFDLYAAGARNGLNRSEDLLDTLTEYPVVLRRLGLSGEESLGLLNQGLIAGARNTDVIADALKEFQIRATDSSQSSADGFQRLGFDAEEMTAKIARGGADARDGLDQVLTALRQTEDPVQRNAAAVELFGTKAEDLGEALFALDPKTAVDGLNGVQGAAQRMFDTIASNDKAKVNQAFRNIDVAVQGIQGTLAAGFSEPLGQVADFVSQNRGPVTQFFLDLVNGALDFGESVVNSAADGSIAFGEFVAGPGADMIGLLIGLQKAINPFADTSQLEGLRDSMRGVDDTTRATAESIRGDLLSGIEQARQKVNEFGEGAVAVGFLNDTSLRLAESLDSVGVGADGARLSLEGVDAANLTASESGAQLDAQVRSAVDALQQQISAAVAAGESQDQLRTRFDEATGALSNQLQQMGLTKEQADNLAARYASFPQMVSTAVVANTASAENSVNRLISTYNGMTIRLNVATDSLDPTSIRPPGRAYGGPIFGPGGPRDDIVPIMASNGEHMLPADEVNAAGGHAGVYRLRAAIRAGMLRLADGGPVRVPAATWRTDVPAAVSAAGAGQFVPASMRAASTVVPASRDINVKVYIDGRQMTAVILEEARSQS